MWVLDVLKPDTSTTCTTEVATTLYLVAGEWTIGRQKTSFTFSKDKSVSRKHAALNVGELEAVHNLEQRQSLTITDLGSSCGTKVNDTKLSTGKQRVKLNAGDQIQFGTGNSIVKVRYIPLVGVISRMHKEHKLETIDNAKKIGMHMLKIPSEKATHCITEDGQTVTTAKILWALVHQQLIITNLWLTAVLSRKKIELPLPDEKYFVPESSNAQGNLFPNEDRLSLFEGYHLVFLRPHLVEDMIPKLGGSTYIAHRDADDQKLFEAITRNSTAKTIVIRPNDAGNGDNSNLQSRLELAVSNHCTIVDEQQIVAAIIFLYQPSALTTVDYSTIVKKSTLAMNEGIVRKPSTDHHNSYVQKHTSGAEETAEPDHRHLAFEKRRDEMQQVPLTPPGGHNAAPQYSIDEGLPQTKLSTSGEEFEFISRKSQSISSTQTQVVVSEPTDLALLPPAPVEVCSLVVNIARSNPEQPMHVRSVSVSGKCFRKGNKDKSNAAVRFIPFSRQFNEPAESDWLHQMQKEDEEQEKQDQLAESIFQFQEPTKKRRKIQRRTVS